MPLPRDVCAEIFECRRCGECCRGFGGTFVDEADILAIAAYLDMKSEAFRNRYCVVSGSRPVLVQQPGGYCAFWDQLCTIHPVKPRMCRDWPFIQSVLVDVANWRIMAGMCPGICPNVSNEHVIACVKEKQHRIP